MESCHKARYPLAMPFSYYHRLSATQKRIYRESDRYARVKLPEPQRFASVLKQLRLELNAGAQRATRALTAELVQMLCQAFRVPGVHVKVLAKRPSDDYGELHGLYERSPGDTPVITVWMRTAKRKQVVAFKTYLHTVIHELMHHLDYESLHLADSFHTHGFYKREANLTKQLLAVLSPK